MKLLRIKDNSQQKKDAFSQVARLTGKIADKTLEQLEREGVFVFPETVKDAEDITQDQMILQSVNDTYRSAGGFLFVRGKHEFRKLPYHFGKKLQVVEQFFQSFLKSKFQQQVWLNFQHRGDIEEQFER